MDINLLRVKFMCDYRYRFVLWNSCLREILFSFHVTFPFPTSVVFLTIHDTLLTARFLSFCLFRFFRWPQMFLTECDFCAVLRK